MPVYVKCLAFFRVDIVHPYVNFLNYLNEIYNIQRTNFGISIAVLNGGKSKLIYLSDLPSENGLSGFIVISFISIMIVNSSFSGINKYIL